MNLIVLTDLEGGIGKNGNQIVYIREDLKRFRALTSGHTIVVGRKTLATFPDGKPLRGRRNMVLSRNVDLIVPGAEVYHDVDGLLAEAPDDAFVVGGAEVYRLMLPHCKTAYITQVLTNFQADTFLPEWRNIRLGENGWKLTESSPKKFSNGILYQFETWQRA